MSYEPVTPENEQSIFKGVHDFLALKPALAKSPDFPW